LPFFFFLELLFDGDDDVDVGVSFGAGVDMLKTN
jgi:hypothetical protein